MYVLAAVEKKVFAVVQEGQELDDSILFAKETKHYRGVKAAQKAADKLNNPAPPRRANKTAKKPLVK